MIRNDDKEGIKKSVLEAKEWIPGILSSNNLRSLKNRCICFIANLTYQIIRDGLISSEEAYSLSDACILLIEQANTEKDTGTAAVGVGLARLRGVSPYGPSAFRVQWNQDLKKWKTILTFFCLGLGGMLCTQHLAHRERLPEA